MNLPVISQETRTGVDFEAFVDDVSAALQAAIDSPLSQPEEVISYRTLNDDSKKQYHGLGISGAADGPERTLISSKAPSTKPSLPKFSKSGKLIPQDGSLSLSLFGMGWFPKDIAESPDGPPSPWMPGARFRMQQSAQDGGAVAVRDTRRHGNQFEASYGSNVNARPAALQAHPRGPVAALVASMWPEDLAGGTVDPHPQAVARVEPQGPVYAEYLTASPECIDGISNGESSEDDSGDYTEVDSDEDSDSFVEIENTETDVIRELMFEIDEVIDLYKGLSDS